MKIKARSLLTVAWTLLIPAGMLFFSSCEEYKIIQEEVDPGETVLFQTQIQPIFNAKCITCHKGTRNPDLRDGNSYESLTTGGYVDLPAADSKLYKKIISSSHASFTIDPEKQLIYNWIDQGALDN
jgi:hypothetical protein